MLIARNLLGVGVGSEETCVPKASLATSMGLASMFLKAVGKEAPGVEVITVVLDNDTCPVWVRGSGNCSVVAKLVDGTLLSANIPTASSLVGTVRKHLSQKYGQSPTKRAETSECYLDGQPIYSAPALDWRLDGLVVTHLPIADARCQFGVVLVRTPEYLRLVGDK